MKKTLVSIVAFLSFLSASAQLKIGTIDNDAALEQIEEYILIEKRIKSSEAYKKFEFYKTFYNRDMQKIEKKWESVSSLDDSLRVSAEIRNAKNLFERQTRSLKIELLKRKQGLLQSLTIKLHQSIEEIALEEGLNLVLHPAHIKPEFRAYVGKENFIDITELVIERISEK